MVFDYRSWKQDFQPIRVLVYMVEGDRRDCSTCTLSPLCPKARIQGACTVTSPPQGVWTDKFAANSVADLEDGLAQVLSLQAKRVQALIDTEAPEDPKLAAEHEKRIDKNLDKVFKNGQALLLTKKPRPGVNSANHRASERMDGLPAAPTGPLIAKALDEMEQFALESGFEFNRESVNPEQVWDWLAARGDVQPLPREQRAIDSAF